MSVRDPRMETTTGISLGTNLVGNWVVGAQECNNTVALSVAGSLQGGSACLIAYGWVRTQPKQELDTFKVILTRGPVHRRVPSRFCCLKVRTEFMQRIDDTSITVHGGNHHRRPSAEVLCIWTGTAVKHALQHVNSLIVHTRREILHSQAAVSRNVYLSLGLCSLTWSRALVSIICAYLLSAAGTSNAQPSHRSNGLAPSP